MQKVASPISIRLATRTGLRPSLSPRYPPMTPPRGRTRNPTPRVAKDSRVPVSGSPEGKKSVLKYSAAGWSGVPGWHRYRDGGDVQGLDLDSAAGVGPVDVAAKDSRSSSPSTSSPTCRAPWPSRAVAAADQRQRHGRRPAGAHRPRPSWTRPTSIRSCPPRRRTPVDRRVSLRRCGGPPGVRSVRSGRRSGSSGRRP